jgi:hypothetical protein
MTIKHSTIPFKQLKPINFIFTEKGKKIKGLGVSGDISLYEDKLTSTTKKNMKLLSEKFMNEFGLKLTWKKLHGAQIKQFYSAFHRNKSAGRDVWTIVYVAETQFGDKIYFHRYEASTAGAGSSNLFANNKAAQIKVSDITQLLSLLSNTKILDWLCHTGIAKNITKPSWKERLDERAARLAVLSELKDAMGRKRWQADLDNIQNAFFLTGQKDPVKDEYIFPQESWDWISSTIAVEKPIKKSISRFGLREDSVGRTYIFRDGGRVSYFGKDGFIYVSLSKNVSENLETAGNATIRKVIKYHTKIKRKAV